MCAVLPTATGPAYASTADVDPWAYLYDVLAKLAGKWPHQRLDELLPAQWKTLYAKPAPATLATTI